MNVAKLSLCTLGLALACALNPGSPLAQEVAKAKKGSHCRGLTEQACSQAVACQWRPAIEPSHGVAKRRAHCRLDMKAASDLARKASQPTESKR